MKKVLQTILFISIISFSFSLYAVEFVVKKNDGSLVFKCEINSTIEKVNVKYRGNGEYTVLTLGRGTTGYSGKLTASSADEAARMACGNE